MLDVIIVGTGHAFSKHYMPEIVYGNVADSIRVIGFVETDQTRWPAEPQFTTAWKVTDFSKIPIDFNRQHVAVMILTPDHYPVVEEYARAGFKRFIIEKPLVSRDEDADKLRSCISTYGLSVYAIDFYIHKLFPLLAVRGMLQVNDPRYRFIRSSAGPVPDADLLGSIEGVAINIVEGGDFALADLAKRPWLANDPQIGGMLRDLGTHALAPLIVCNLIDHDAGILDVHLSCLTDDLKSMRRVKNGEIEMHVSALITGKGNVPISLAFGKVPLEGGIWSIAVRGSKGMFYSALRSGNASVFVDSKSSAALTLTKNPSALVLDEAALYFEDRLPGHDGYVSALLDSLSILSRIRERNSANM